MLFGLPLVILLGQLPVAPAPTFSDFPPSDSSLIWVLRHGQTVKSAREYIAQRTDTAEALKAVFEAEKYTEALDMLERIMARHPDRLADALQVASTNMWQLNRGASDQARRLQTLAALAASKLDSFERAEAARVARQLVGIQAQGPRPSYAERLSQFAQEYTGTDAAGIADLEAQIFSKRTPEIISFAERMAEEHPRSVLGARALYEKAFQLSSNVAITGIEPRGSDPTARFLQVVEIVKQLESGEFPDCEWTRRAPDLVGSFFASNPRFDPGNADRMLGAYDEYVRTHWRMATEYPLSSGTGFVITTKMRDLFKAAGDPDGVERTLVSLERDGPDPDGARYLRALYYARLAAEPSPPPDMLSRAASLLDRLRSGPGPYSGRALATLAFLRFERGDCADARRLFSVFVTTHPQSSYAWLAAVHAGQSAEMVGDLEGAASTYDAAARANSANGMAAALAWSLEADALEGQGRTKEAAAAMARAVAAWDPDYGIEYTISTPGNQAAAARGVMRRVAKRDLETRSRELSVAAATPGGPVLARARWLLMKERRDEAVATSQAFLRQYPRSPLAADARYVSHRARFEIALERGNVEATVPADSASVDRMLAQVDDGNWDTAVALSKIARASLVSLRKDPSADALMDAALREWHDRQVPPAAADAIGRDVIAIREAVFRPTGGGIYQNPRGGWNAFSWPADLPPYVMVDPVVRVRLSDGSVTRMAAAHGGMAADRTIFLGADEQQGLARILARLGGTRVGVPQSIMIVNAPVGGSMEILALWKKFFPSRPGHWFGWEFTTYPQVTEVGFLDAARTRAVAKVTIGYSGATVLLEKRAGRWIPTDLRDFWIT